MLFGLFMPTAFLAGSIPEEMVEYQFDGLGLQCG